MLKTTKQAIVTEFRINEILEAARALFARKGYNATTMEEVAEEAGLAKGTLYLYFSSKQEIYLKALHVAADALIERGLRAMAQQQGFRKKLRTYIDSRLQYAEEQRDFCKIYCQELAGQMHPVAAVKEIRELESRASRALMGVLKEALRRKEIRSVKVEETAALIVDMIRGLILRRLFAGSRKSIEEDGDFLCEMILRGIGV